MGEGSHWNMVRQIPEIIFIGSGNVATQLALSFDKVANVTQIWSHTLSNAKILADKLESCQAIDNFSDLKRSADLYLVCIPDDKIEKIVFELRDVTGIIAHTSGSVSLKKLAETSFRFSNVGVFYPLQTFSKTRNIDLKEVPILIEGNNEEVTGQLMRYASLISKKICEADSKVRGDIHLAAVFANNFTNYLYRVSDRILKERTNFDLKILAPLLKEGIEKALAVGPENSQTGPAKRKDIKIICEHLNKLEGKDADLYRLITERILES